MRSIHDDLHKRITNTFSKADFIFRRKSRQTNWWKKIPDVKDDVCFLFRLDLFLRLKKWDFLWDFLSAIQCMSHTFLLLSLRASNFSYSKSVQTTNKFEIAMNLCFMSRSNTNFSWFSFLHAQPCFNFYLATCNEKGTAQNHPLLLTICTP